LKRLPKDEDSVDSLSGKDSHESVKINKQFVAPFEEASSGNEYPLANKVRIKDKIHRSPSLVRQGKHQKNTKANKEQDEKGPHAIASVDSDIARNSISSKVASFIDQKRTRPTNLVLMPSPILRSCRQFSKVSLQRSRVQPLFRN
jgi:hypothetical protein